MPLHQYILVIDDDAVIRNLISELLTDEGYSVLTASTGIQALRTIAAHPPVLCLVDLRMPQMSGMRVLEHLRAQGLRQLPVVVMSASTHDAKRIRAAGIACLDKPFDLDALLACVARYVGSPQQTSTA